ncbi:hypothetical protein LOTGIDRAFT_173636 [Lottia gigantea]|uniref:Integrase zinc-binding domain-containing protein n=1 Tax=Lottia gigantea TaxID=225164 RepID=V4A6R8_LOTGI|nr:hypothetical protein LOTGIDRAFT_173636 [Lottia gigantea]ESO99628.1 hypothetical protein LOTGIDRAFT_173636 [Lottia gigantea]
MRTGLDISELHDLSTTHNPQTLATKIAHKQSKCKSYTDLKRCSKLLNLNVGDSVRVRKPNHVRKGDFDFTTPRKVVAKPYDSAYELDDGKVWNQERLAKARVSEIPIENRKLTTDVPDETATLRRSDRSVHKPIWHKDYL